MNLQGNTILITGGNSGIGRGMAEAFHRLGNKVIISGRRQSALDAVTAAHPGMEAVRFDAADPEAIRNLAQTMRKRFPNLNVLINNAGIQSPENLRTPSYVQTNLGPNHGTDPRAMSLADFIGEVMTILRDDPTATEIVVERCKSLRFAAESGEFSAAFKGLSGAMG